MSTSSNTGELKLIADVQQTIIQLQKVKNELKGMDTQAEKSSEKSKMSFDDMAKNVGKFTAAVGIAVYTVKKLVDASIQQEQKKLAFDMLKTANSDLAEMVLKTEELSNGMLRATDMAATMNAAMVRGVPITAEKYERLIKLSTKLALAQGKGVEEIMDGFVTGIARMSPPIMENTGIIVNANKEYELFAARLNKTAKSLSDTEKKTALLNAMLEEGEIKVAKYGDVLENVHAKNIKKLQKINNLMKTVAEGATDLLVKWMDFGTYLGESLAEDIAKTKEIHRYGEQYGLAYQEAKNYLEYERIATEKAKEETIKFNKALKDSRKELEDLGGAVDDSLATRIFGALPEGFKISDKQRKNMKKHREKEITDIKAYNNEKKSLAMQLSKVENDKQAKDFKNIDDYMDYYKYQLSEANLLTKEYTKKELEIELIKAKALKSIMIQQEEDKKNKIKVEKETIANLEAAVKEGEDRKIALLKDAAEKEIEIERKKQEELKKQKDAAARYEEDRTKDIQHFKDLANNQIMSSTNAMYSAMLDDQEHSLSEMVGMAMQQAGGALVADGTKNLLIAAGLTVNPLTTFSGAALAGIGTLEVATGFGMGYTGKALSSSGAESVSDTKDLSKGDAATDRISLEDEYKQTTEVYLFKKENGWLKTLDDSIAKIK